MNEADDQQGLSDQRTDEEDQSTEYPRDGGVDGSIVIANEFADVVVRRVASQNGMRLEIWSPRRGSKIHLDAVVLDCLSYQEPEVFTEMLERRPGG